MRDDKPHKPRPLYSAWPIVVLFLFFSGAISLWSESRPLAIIVILIGIAVYWTWVQIQTKMIREELTLKQLFKNM